MMDIEFLIKTFERKDCLERLLLSLEKFYPKYPIIIVDDSEEFDKKFYKQFNLNIRILHVGYDVGLSYGRNVGWQQSDKKYICLLDDDFVFTEKTDIEKLYKIAESTGAGVVAGSLQNVRKVDGYDYNLVIRDNTLFYEKGKENWEKYKGIEYRQSEIVYNFGLFRVEMLKEHSWDNFIKIKGEHSDFFLRLKETEWQALYVPEVVVKHIPVRDRHYNEKRSRNQYLAYMMKKHNIKTIVSPSGTMTELINNKIITGKKYESDNN